MNVKLGLVGIGKIARDQHLPVVNKHPGFELLAAASPHSQIDQVSCYKSVESMLENCPEIEAVALCMPPGARYRIACKVIAAGKHVLLEKPPGATLSEVDSLVKMASDKGISLYCSWHSRHAAGVEQARTFLQSAQIESVKVRWLEDVRQWHPGQQWIWEAGGLGVFDPGINALSIISYILPCDFLLKSSVLSFPENKQAPIAAELQLRCSNGAAIDACFDWRQQGEQFWTIEIESDKGSVVLKEGGSRLFLAGVERRVGEHNEYKGVYDYFHSLIANASSDADCRPLTYVADAFMLGQRIGVERFSDG